MSVAEWATEAAILRLREEWTKGTPTSAIGRLFDVSKNAIVGKAHRLGLPEREQRGGLRNRFHWNFASVETLRSRRAAGLGWDAIGQEIGCSDECARYKGQILGLPEPAVRITQPRAARTLPPPVPRALPPLTPVRPAWVPEPPPRQIVHPVPMPRPTPPAPERSVRSEPCCWVVTEGGKGKLARYCDAPGVPGRPYCRPHTAKAYLRVGRQPAANAAAQMGGN